MAEQAERDRWVDCDYESETEEMMYWHPGQPNQTNSITRTQSVYLHSRFGESLYSMRRAVLFHVPNPPDPVQVPGFLSEAQAGELVSLPSFFTTRFSAFAHMGRRV